MSASDISHKIQQKLADSWLLRGPQYQIKYRKAESNTPLELDSLVQR